MLINQMNSGPNNYWVAISTVPNPTYIFNIDLNQMNTLASVFLRVRSCRYFFYSTFNKDAINTQQLYNQSRASQSLNTKPNNNPSDIKIRRRPDPEITATAHYLPKMWKPEQVLNLLDPTGTSITHVSPIYNSIGAPTGKFVISFRDNPSMQRCVKQFHEEYIKLDEQLRKIAVVPYKTPPAQSKDNTKQTYDVKLANIDFGLSDAEIRRFAQDFGQIEVIRCARSTDGRNRGSAIIGFKDAKAARKFIEFANGLSFLGRKLKAGPAVVAPKAVTQPRQKPVHVPWRLMEANVKLYREMLRNTSKEVGDQNNDNSQKWKRC